MAEVAADVVTEAVPAPADSGAPLRVVVFSCGDLGFEVAARLAPLGAVAQVTLITTPYRQKRLGLAGKLRHVYRMQGPWGIPAVLLAKLPRPFRRRREAGSAPGDGAPALPPSVQHLQFEEFHTPEALEAVARSRPDLGVVAGTYILREELFSVPRLGSINLHSGKVPEYRGAAPAFWELYNGEPVVGITIHRVARAVDAGQVLLQELFPLDRAPLQEPLAYLEEYRRTVLRPNGVRMLVQAVEGLAAGTLQGWAQDPARARTYRSPDYRAIRELRRRVRRRRDEGVKP